MMKILLICLFAFTVSVQEKKVERLQDVQKIFIGSMGQSDEAERFRLLLEESLTKEKFIVVENEKDAEAILTGILTLRVYDKKSTARATVRLKNQASTLLWSGEFSPKISFSRKDT